MDIRNAMAELKTVHSNIELFSKREDKVWDETRLTEVIRWLEEVQEKVHIAIKALEGW